MKKWGSFRFSVCLYRGVADPPEAHPAALIPQRSEESRAADKRAERSASGAERGIRICYIQCKGLEKQV